nr:unnamed protein product [Callosobruchus chinensis]
MTISLPHDKREKLKNVLLKVKSGKTFKIREFAKLLGTLVSTCKAIRYGYLYTKLFEQEKYLALRKNNGNYNATMQISSSLMPDIRWWIRNLPNNINSIGESKYVLEIFSDASNTGWDVYSNNVSSSGF